MYCLFLPRIVFEILRGQIHPLPSRYEVDLQTPVGVGIKMEWLEWSGVEYRVVHPLVNILFVNLNETNVRYMRNDIEYIHKYSNHGILQKKNIFFYLKDICKIEHKQPNNQSSQSDSHNDMDSSHIE